MKNVAVHQVFDGMLRTRYKAATLVGYCKNMKTFCDFLTIWVDELSTDERAHIKRLRDAVNQLQRGFDGMKPTVNRHTQCSDVAARNAPSITDVTNVVSLAEIPALKILQNAENNDYWISSTDLQFLNSYFIAKHCLGNAQRVSMLNNMQLSEFNTAIETTKVLRDMTDGHGKVLTDDEGNVKQETNYVICVAEYKTKESYIGNLTISEDQVQLFNTYIKIRARILTDKRKTSEMLFVNSEGNAITNGSDLISKLHKKVGLKVTKSVTQARKASQTLADSASNPVKKILTRYLRHSEQVADQNYRELNTDKAVDAYQYMARMRVFNAAYPTK